MEQKNIVQHFEGKTILVTGSTGFLAKIFLEKLLRIQPNVKKIFLLIRGTDKLPAEKRLYEEVFNSEVFSVLRDKWRAKLNSILISKVIPVSGDVSNEDLGILDSELRDHILQEVDIIVNSAATVKFDERYDVAMSINALGTMHLQNFARKCSKVEIFLQVSTAYVHGTRTGILMEKPFSMGETLEGANRSYLDIEAEKKIIEEQVKELMAENATEKEIKLVMRDLGIERAKLHGWPNTYVFTKAIGEMLLNNPKENFKVIILRPTIITSTFQEPFPGWMEGLKTVDSIYVGYAKGNIKFFVGDPESIQDMIPGDMVVNCMLAAIAMNSNQPSHQLIYHVGSSWRNPLEFTRLKEFMYIYLTKNPFPDSSGKHIVVGEPKTLNTMASFHRSLAIRYLPILMVLKLLNVILCNLFRSVYVNARRKISHAKYLAELYKPYLFFRGIFDDTNTEKLRMAVRETNANVDMFNFDPTCIQWEDYFTKAHFPGISKYVLK